VFLNPGFVSKNSPTPEQKEILRLYEATGDKTIFPRIISDKITFTVKGGSQSYTLSQEEKPLYQKRMGELAQQKISKLINTKGYSLYPEAQKVKIFYSILGDASEQAKQEFLKSKQLR
jgi:hypothetical protein